ncbi:MAG: hypothetical protein RRY40_03725 [Oscillospiraceae bacterium]
MKAKKILALILAVMLGLGALSPLVYLMASAATFEIGTATNMGDYEIIKGTPDINVFSKTGLYTFTIQENEPSKIFWEKSFDPGNSFLAD